MSENGYCVRGILSMLQSGSVSIEEATEVIDEYIELASRRGYAEALTETIKKTQRNTRLETREGV